MCDVNSNTSVVPIQKYTELPEGDYKSNKNDVFGTN